MGESVMSTLILGFVLPAVSGTVCKPYDPREMIREPQFYTLRDTKTQSLTCFQCTSLFLNLHYKNKLNNTKQTQQADCTINDFILNDQIEFFLRLYCMFPRTHKTQMSENIHFLLNNPTIQ